MSSPCLDTTSFVVVPRAMVRVVLIIYIALLITLATTALVLVAGWGPHGLAVIAGLLATVTAATSSLSVR